MNGRHQTSEVSEAASYPSARKAESEGRPAGSQLCSPSLKDTTPTGQRTSSVSGEEGKSRSLWPQPTDSAAHTS